MKGVLDTLSIQDPASSEKIPLKPYLGIHMPMRHTDHKDSQHVPELASFANAAPGAGMILIRRLQECLRGSHLHALQANSFLPCICFLAVSQLPVQMAVADAVQTTQIKEYCLLYADAALLGSWCSLYLLLADLCQHRHVCGSSNPRCNMLREAHCRRSTWSCLCPHLLVQVWIRDLSDTLALSIFSVREKERVLYAHDAL